MRSRGVLSGIFKIPQCTSHLGISLVLHDGVLAGEPVLVPQAALGGVALLPGNTEVVFQYPVDDAGKGAPAWDGGGGFCRR